MNISQVVSKALYTALVNDEEVKAHGATGVFVMEAPLNQPFPYILVEAGTYVPWDSYQQPGFDATVMLYVWSGLYDGDRYEDIVSDIYRLFHHPLTPLQMEQYQSVSSECEWMTVVDNQEQDTRHVPIRVRLLQQ